MVPNITLPINHPESTPGIRPIIREVLRLHNPYILCIKKKKNSEIIEHPKIDINITKVLNPLAIDFWYNPEIKDNNGNVFCIVNINEQKRKNEQDKEKITKKLQKDVDNDKITQDEMDKLMNIFKLDYRKKYPGKNS